jgi:arylsulfatase A-like enzyme
MQACRVDRGIFAARAVQGALVLAATLAGCRPVQHTSSVATLPSYRCPDCNVLLISIDTLRADHLHVYGYNRDTSPNIDRLAKDSVLFEQNVNTGGGTLSVHASMFTSLPPTVHGVWADNGRALETERVTLAEQLRGAGYHTRGYTGGGYVCASLGLSQGFDFFYDRGGNFAVELPMLYQWLDTYESGKFFLFLHTYDVHSGFDKLPYDHGGFWNRRYTESYHGGFDGCRGGLCASTLLATLIQEAQAGKRPPPAAAFSRDDIDYMAGLYDGGIAYTDSQLGYLFDRLKAQGLWDKTLIVLTADHGEELAEHGRFLHTQNYEETARVPLIIRFPHGAYGGRRISELVSTLEVMPTILDVLGIPGNPEIEGQSVMPLITGGQEGRQWVYVAGSNEKLRTPAWTLLTDEHGAAELYDLAHDPHETANLIARHRQLAATLYNRYLGARQHDLRVWRQLLLARTKGQSDSLAVMSPGERDRLRALGYLR